MLISRFLLNLKAVTDAQGKSALPSSPSQFNATGFRFPTIAEVIDDMGEDLHQQSHDDDEADVEREPSDLSDAPPAITVSTPPSESEVELESVIQITPRRLDF